MTTKLINHILDKYLVPRDEFIYGFADLTDIIDKQFGNFKYGISIGKKLNYRIVDSVQNGPNLEYYNHYRDTNDELSMLSTNISNDMKKSGIDAICIEPSLTTQVLDTVYSGTLRTRLSHKMVATRAGLGWIGKTDLLVTKKFGPRLRLVTILTNAALLSETVPINRSRCGSCNICVEKCPAKAANGKLWDIFVDRDEFYDPFKCREMCKEFGDKVLKMNVRVCGICVSVCPIGKI